MSEFNEDMLNDVDGYPDLAEADEEALLQDDDDGDVLDLVPEELEESLDDARVHISEQDDDSEETQREKFSVERQRITAPETSTVEDTNNTPKQNNNRFPRSNNRGFQRGRNSNGRGRFPGRGRFTYGNQAGRNKTVLINPRFQGVVHVNNNARLAWDTPPQQQYHNPWGSNAPPAQMGHPMQPMADSPMQSVPTGAPMQQPMHGFHGYPNKQPDFHGPPMHHAPMPPAQHMGPPGQQLQYIPPQQPFMPQPLPPGVQHAPMQHPPSTPYWDGQNQYSSFEQGPNPFMQNNYQPPQHAMMQSPPAQAPTPNFQMYNQQGNITPMPQNNFNNNPNFNVSQNTPTFPNNNNQGNIQYNQVNNRPNQNRREIFTQKRKVMTPGFSQNKKVVVQDRLGPIQKAIKIERQPVVKEVTVTNITTVKIEEDEDTRDLRLKIEEQKRKREAILEWKEKRRLEKLGQFPDTAATDQKVVITQAHQVNQPSPVKRQPSNIIISKQTQVRQPVVRQQVVRQPVVRQQVVKQKIIQQPPAEPQLNWPARFKKSMGNNIVITNGYSRKFTKYQQKKAQEASRIVLPIATVSVPVQAPEQDLKLDQKHLSNFLADRKILTKDETLMPTRKVVIKNISTSTGDKKIFQISKSIGEVQKLHRDKNERQATITFKSVASAHAFFKKYRRHMLDLSMIEVSLCPMTESDE